MQDLKLAISSAEAARGEVHALMTAVNLVIHRVESRLDTFVARREFGVDGALRALVDDISHLYEIAMDLGQLATAVATPARARIVPSFQRVMPQLGNGQGGAELRQSVERALDYFDKTAYAVDQVAMRAQSHVSELREAALRRDAAPELVAAVDQLLLRFRRHCH